LVSPPEIVSVAIGFEVGPTLPADTLVLNDPARGLLNTGKLGNANSFVTVTDDIRRITITRGAQRVDSPVIRYEPGTAEVVLDNATRDYDPENLDGPYVAGGVSQVTASRPVVISANWASTDYRLYTGFAESFDLDWNGDNWAEVSVPCSDGLSILSQTERAAVAIIGTGDDTGARITRILDSAEWPDEDRIIATGDATLLGTTLEGPALEELQQASDSEIGELYVDGSGNVVFRNRSAIYTESRSVTSQATFGDDEPAELAYAYNGLKFSTDRETLYNRVIGQRDGGSVVQADDATSQGSNRIKTWSKTDLVLEDDTQVTDYVAWILNLSKDPENRFTEMIIYPLADPDNLFPQVLGRQIGDRITCIRRPPGGGDPIQRDVFIRAIKHEISITNWITTWTFQSATKFAFLTLDDPVLGKLDQNALGF
jgi:hypothetical protein